eukprot:11713-Heterococcus_DN1.PRE.2
MLPTHARNADWSLSFQLKKLKRSILYSTKELAKDATCQRLPQQTAHSMHAEYGASAVSAADNTVYHADLTHMAVSNAMESRCSDNVCSYTAVDGVLEDKKLV